MFKVPEAKGCLESKSHKKAMISEDTNPFEEDNLTKGLWLICNG